ncbi:MAG TPA: LytR C-terminal domain-containing protein [Nocardioides sp.]|jgi:hypothetical protein|nr:LytR C-terminal domain-containing protein [Nocardioides sp.]
MNLTTHVKTLLTLAVLAVLLFVGITFGWSAMTEPFPHTAATKICYPTRLEPGDRVSAPKVTVSVFNASTRIGLAESTMSAFENQGFGPGSVGNAPKNAVIHYAQIWAQNRNDPAVRLVASRLGPNAAIVAKKHAGPGVVVMVGPLFQKLVEGKQSTKVTSPTTICSPPTS